MITKKTKSFNWDQIWHFSTEEPKLPYEKIRYLKIGIHLVQANLSQIKGKIIP